MTSILCGQLNKCSAMSSGSLQNEQDGVGDFLVLCRRSLVGKRFWSGDKQSQLDGELKNKAARQERGNIGIIA